MALRLEATIFALATASPSGGGQDRHPLDPLAIYFVDGEIFVAGRAEGVEHARFFDRLHAVRNVAGEIIRIAGRHFMRLSFDDQFHPTRQDVDDLFLRMSMFRHFAAGNEGGQHLVHCLSTRNGLPLDTGANFDPGIFVFHEVNLRRAIVGRFCETPILKRRLTQTPYNLTAK